MRINKRLWINALISLLIAITVGFTLALSLYQLNKANNLSLISSNIITRSFERVSLRNDYIQTNSERAKQQWFAKSQQIGELLKSAPEYFQRNEDKKIIAKLVESHESSLQIFSALVANREKNYRNDRLEGLSLEVEARLLNQLNMRIYERVLQSRALQESSRTARATAVRLASGGMISALFVMIAMALSNLWSSRVISDRINHLRKGVKVIGDGDLDHHIDIKGKDEFSELSVAFNEMTAKLSKSYHDLNVEIEVRKQAEEALLQSEERLALTASATQIGMFDWNLTSGSVLWTHAHEAIFGYVPATTTATTAATAATTTTKQYDYRKWADRVHPDDLPLVEEESRICQLENKPLESQYRESAECSH
jgi:nitrate/nitrite-specific signal transduction histidine kinase